MDNYCKDCGKKTKCQNSIRCRSCAAKEWHKGRILPITEKRRIWLNTFKHTSESKAKISEALRLQWENGTRHQNRKGTHCSEEHKENMSFSIKQYWDKVSYEERQKRIQKALTFSKIKPNKCEKFLETLLNKLFPEEYEWSGDGRIVVGGKNPDFTCVTGKNKFIELYGDRWHKGEDPQDRINIFNSYGYACLVIWEHELKEFNTIDRLIKFHQDLELPKRKFILK
jgi:hypothetical protein